MTTWRLQLGILTALTLLSFTAHGKLFRNAYVQFELPPNWDCAREETEYVCTSKSKKPDGKIDAIIILTAKETGPQDSFAAYERHLRTPKQAAGKDGRPLKSKISYVKQVKINDHQWTDALHKGGEIPIYFTRYLATVKDKIAILVTFSVHQALYSKYNQDFFKAAQSLRVTANQNLTSPTALAPIRPGSETLGVRNEVIPPVAGMESDGAVPPPTSGASDDLDPLMLAGLGLLIAALGYYLWSKK